MGGGEGVERQRNHRGTEPQSLTERQQKKTQKKTTRRKIRRRRSGEAGSSSSYLSDALLLLCEALWLCASVVSLAFEPLKARRSP